MPSGLQAILPILLLLFHAHMQGQQNTPQPGQPKGAGGTQAPQPAMPQRPESQGSKGIGQGHQGGMTQALGGLGSLFNMAGLHPHQSVHAPGNNPLSLLAGQK